MSIRAKTKRRVIILLAVCCTVTGLIAGVYAWRRHTLHKFYLQNRAEGLVAFSQKDYEASLQKLSLYLGKEQAFDDREARFAYAKSRAMVETNDGRHIVEARQAFRSYLELDPDNVEAQRELLELYKKNNYDVEVVALADKLLAKMPDDLQAMKRKSEALLVLHKYDEALPLAEKVNEMDPMDLSGQRVTLTILVGKQEKPEVVIERAKKAVDKYPNDPRFEMLLGVAHHYARETETSKKVLRSAATKPAPDPEFVRQLAQVFNQLGMFDDTQKLLDRNPNFASDPQITRLAVQTMWQNSRYGDVVEYLKDLNPADKKNTEHMAMKALSLFQLGKREEAEKVLGELASREGDGPAAAWVTVLRARFAEPALPPQELAAQIQSALTRTPRTGIFEFMLAEAYYQMGETELAVRHWRASSDHMPGWSRPRVLIARSMLATGRVAEGFEAAQKAHALSPNNVLTNTTMAAAAWAQLQQKPDPEYEKKVLGFVTGIQNLNGPEPDTLPIYVSLLVRHNRRDDAIAAVKSAIESDRVRGEALQKLLAVVKSEKLGLEEQLKQKQATTEAGSPGQLYAQAIALSDQGKPTEGLALLQKAADAAPPAMAITWKINVLKYREAITDQGVADAWVELGNQNPKDLQVQRALLRDAQSAWTNRPFVSSTIDRLRAITGDDAIEWRIARAKYLLSNGGDEKQQKEDASAASVILSDIVRSAGHLVEARVLWAGALHTVGNDAGAIEQLKTAAELKPGDVTIVFDLIRLMRSQGKTTETTELLERLARNTSLTLEGRKRVAAMLAENGLVNRAVDIITAEPADAADMGRNVMLGDLYRRQGKIEDARKVYNGLLASPTTNATVIQAGADFFGARRELDTARKFLARLDELQVRPGTKEIILANFEERHGDATRSAALFAEAAKLMPTDALRWRMLIGHHLRRGQYDKAIAAADESLKHLPNDDSLQALRRQSEAVRTGSNSTDLQPLIDTLAADPKNEAVVLTLSVINEARKEGAKPAEMVAKLQQVARKYPTALPVQMLVARAAAAIGRLKEGAEISTRAMHTFPNDPDPAKLSVIILSTAGKWQEAKFAAQQWRLRTLENPQAADLAIAETQCKLGDGNDALATLSAYAPGVKADPNANVATTVSYCRALITAGRAPHAEALLLPLLASSPEWRDRWLDLSVNHATAKSAGEWIEKLAGVMPRDPKSQGALANAWYDIGQRYDDTTFLLKSAVILNKLTSDADVTARTWMLLASVNEMQGNYAEAEQGYRRALKIEPKNPIAQNNLAYLLLLQNRDAEEGLALAKEAVASPQATASFHDTLARLYVRARQKDQAVKSFNDALTLDPNSIDAMIGLADVLNDMGKRQEAALRLTQIDSVLKADMKLSPMLRQQLDTLRKSLRAETVLQ